MDTGEKNRRDGDGSSRQSLDLIEHALHFPFRKLDVSDFPLQRLLILMAIYRHDGTCETAALMRHLPSFTKASLSRHLKALREMHLIEPQEVVEDLRRKSWRMTHDGRQFMTDWQSAINVGVTNRPIVTD